MATGAAGRQRHMARRSKQGWTTERSREGAVLPGRFMLFSGRDRRSEGSRWGNCFARSESMGSERVVGRDRRIFEDEAAPVDVCSVPPALENPTKGSVALAATRKVEVAATFRPGLRRDFYWSRSCFLAPSSPEPKYWLLPLPLRAADARTRRSARVPLPGAGATYIPNVHYLP